MILSRRKILSFLSLAGLESSLAQAAEATLPTPNLWNAIAAEPHSLKLEWQAAPCGIDTKRPRFSWHLRAPGRGMVQSAYRIRVADSPDRLAAGLGNIWDSGKCRGGALRATPPDDLALRSQTPYWWNVTVWDGEDKASWPSHAASFLTGIFEEDGWQAQWIAAEPDGPPQPLPPIAAFAEPVESQAMPVFRRTLVLTKRVKRAIVCVTGLGQYELHLNTARAGTGYLVPGWTDYRKTVLYNTLDVTHLLRRGDNEINIMLGNGMYHVERYLGRYTKFAGSFGQPKCLFRMKLAYADGSEEFIASDTSWTTRPGPITLSSIYGGEDFDARRREAGTAKPALAVEGPGGRLRAQAVASVAAVRSFKPVKVSEPKPGVYVYDFGANYSGWPQIKLRGEAGRIVRLMPGELLDANGTVTQQSMGARSDMAVLFHYTLAGRGTEAWHPRFSYTGFRYIKVEGAAPKGRAGKGVPELLDIESVFLHDGLAQTGRFDCADRLIVRIHELISQALLSNTFSVLTDCPTREKLGWLEQTYLNADTVFCNEDAITLYEKMARDIADSQLENGMVPGHAPEYVAFVDKSGADEIWRNSPEWGAAVVFSPWAAYRYCGDKKVLEDAYSAMARYADYLQARLKDGLLDFGMGDWYDIGPKPPGPAQLTSLELTGTATYYGMLTVLERIARLLCRDGDAADYASRAAAVKTAFNARLFDPATSRYDRGSQTAYAMPLALGLVPEENRGAVLDKLIAAVRATGNHVTAGDIGFHYVVLALMQAGRSDVLYDMVTVKSAPSYAAQLARGATALTEAWDANPRNSQDHFMLGHAETWFYRGLAGIGFDMAADDPITIAPQIVKHVPAASAAYRSVLGDIACAWRKRHGSLHVHVEIPAGAKAMLVLPCAAADRISESGKPLTAAKGIGAAQTDGNTIRMRIGSGRYDFTLPCA